MADAPNPFPLPYLKSARELGSFSPMPRYRALHALLSNIIDYAGTYPPAALSLDQALKLAAGYRRQALHPWLMGRVALSSAHLREIAIPRMFENGADGTNWIFTSVGEPLESAMLSGTILREWKWADEFNTRHNGTSLFLRVQSIEWKIGGSIDFDALNTTLRALSVTPTSPSRLYFEAVQGQFDALSAALSRANDAPHGPDLGLKIRLGGAEVPDAEELAQMLALCSELGLLFKATQGLHHPLTRGSEFGFVNVFFALGLANSRKVTIPDLVSCLKASEASFEENSVRIGAWELSSDEIEDARAKHRGCFGSCSLQEPDQFLADELEKGNR